jgi:hypothetical protein
VVLQEVDITRDDLEPSPEFGLCNSCLYIVIKQTFPTNVFTLVLCKLVNKRRMPSSGMWHCLSFVTLAVSEECVASIFRVEGISQLGTTLAITSIFC